MTYVPSHFGNNKFATLILAEFKIYYKATVILRQCGTSTKMSLYVGQWNKEV